MENAQNWDSYTKYRLIVSEICAVIYRFLWCVLGEVATVEPRHYIHLPLGLMTKDKWEILYEHTLESCLQMLYTILFDTYNQHIYCRQNVSAVTRVEVAQCI
jgi:hypothetical protein